MITNTKVGVDVSFEKIRREYDAVLLGIGAWVSTGVRCKGEDSQGIIGGIDLMIIQSYMKHGGDFLTCLMLMN